MSLYVCMPPSSGNNEISSPRHLVMRVFFASVKREKNDLSKSSHVTAATEFKQDDIELKL